VVQREDPRSRTCAGRSLSANSGWPPGSLRICPCLCRLRGRPPRGVQRHMFAFAAREEGNVFRVDSGLPV
jgi:hypothetical protein